MLDSWGLINCSMHAHRKSQCMLCGRRCLLHERHNFVQNSSVDHFLIRAAKFNFVGLSENLREPAQLVLALRQIPEKLFAVFKVSAMGTHLLHKPAYKHCEGHFRLAGLGRLSSTASATMELLPNRYLKVPDQVASRFPWLVRMGFFSNSGSHWHGLSISCL